MLSDTTKTSGLVANSIKQPSRFGAPVRKAQTAVDGKAYSPKARDNAPTETNTFGSQVDSKARQTKTDALGAPKHLTDEQLSSIGAAWGLTPDESAALEGSLRALVEAFQEEEGRRPNLDRDKGFAEACDRLLAGLKQPTRSQRATVNRAEPVAKSNTTGVREALRRRGSGILRGSNIGNRVKLV